MAIQHHYILVQITQAGALLLTEQQRLMIRAAMATLNIPVISTMQPVHAFQARISLDGNSAIYEVHYDDDVTPAQAFASVAAALGLDAAQLQLVIAYTIWTGSQDESAAAAREYLAAHRSEWEPDDL